MAPVSSSGETTTTMRAMATMESFPKAANASCSEYMSSRKEEWNLDLGVLVVAILRMQLGGTGIGADFQGLLEAGDDFLVGDAPAQAFAGHHGAHQGQQQ